MNISFSTSRFLASFFLLVLCAGTVLPARAHAFLGVGDIVNDPIHTGVNVATGGFTAGLNIKEYALDPLAYSVSKIALHSLTKSVVNWINTGFNGSPAFVQDLNQSLLSVGDAEANRFIDEFVNSGSLQDVPWKDDIAQSVLSGYFRSTSRDSFSLQNPYTLNKVSNDPEAFVKGDFSKGGLDAWMSLVLNPANSPRGLFEATKNTLNSRVSSAKGTKVTELNWSNGFNSFRGDCKKTTSSYLGGTSVGNSPVLSFDASGSVAGPATTLTDLTNTDTCAGQPILTPGALIAQSANKYLVDAGVDQYVGSDEISEIINALMGQLVGNVLGGGGLLGVSSPTSGGGRSYIDRATDPSSSTGSTFNVSQSFLTTLAKQSFQISQYKENWTKIGDAAHLAQTSLGGTSCSLVSTTLSQTGSAVASATSALTALESIKNKLTVNVASDPTSQTTLVANATTEYEALLASGTLPSITDITYASLESLDRQADSKTGTTASLYTQMTQIASSKMCSL